ncbi:hypothetical protein C9374_010388 [Naegleria lovaniensis]|uniref:Uncharacterized protein n=1 Tax=Naegleria lovaniensis TaxID=51637 RepID=A0AA88GI62_NAELO|nr:uncharacterized protein C9374_010388 [Naegleria lovaniensis]KAG2375014.1 hypothetical protein C9374_010388 [Naegleria lovaniensis]
MLDNNESNSNSSGVLTLSNPSTTSSYIHSNGVNNDYYLPPSGEREDMNNSNMSSSEDVEPADHMENFSESGLGVHEYGSFTSRLHDFSSPITTKPPSFPEKNLQVAKKGVVQAPPRPTNPFASIPPAMNHHSIPPSNNNVINSITATTTNTQSEPSSPSNTFREFLEGEAYRRPILLSPLSADNVIVEEQQQTLTNKKQPSSSSTKNSSTAATTKQPTNPSVNINSSKSTAASSSTNGNSVTEQKVEPPPRPTISNKTLLLANRMTAQPPKPQQDEESNNESSDHEISTKKPVVSKKESKRRSSHESDSENNMEDISHESSEEHSDKKSKKKKSTTQPEAKKKAEKETKIKGVKSRKTTKAEVGESSSSSQGKKSSDTKKTASSPKRPLEDVVESKPSVNEEPKTKRNKQPTSMDNKNVSMKTEHSIATASSSTSTHTNNSSTRSSSSLSRDINSLQQKLESKRKMATSLKHKADDLKKEHQISEAISTYLASGMQYSEAAMYSKHIFENTPKEKNPSTSGTALLLKQNIDFLKYVASLALKYAYYDKAVLANILIFTNTKALFNFKTQSIQRYRRYLIGKFSESNSTSMGSSSITSPAAVASPSSQSISTPSPVHNGGGSLINSVDSAELTNTIIRLCTELEIISMTVDNEETLYHQLKQHETYRENYELMHEAHRGNIDFVVKFLTEELVRLDLKTE